MENLNTNICLIKCVEQIVSWGENVFTTHYTEYEDFLPCSQETEVGFFIVHKILFDLEHHILFRHFLIPPFQPFS